MARADFERCLGLAALSLALAGGSTRAQEFSGGVATPGCDAMVSDLRAASAEIYALKTHNPGRGPDEHADLIFDLRSKGGAAVADISLGGPSWTISRDAWQRSVVPPEQVFVILTFPDGRLAIDSAVVRDVDDSFGVVMQQVVGDALPVGIASGTGMSLPGTADPYLVPGTRERGGAMTASFPQGTNSGISVAFAPVADVAGDPIDGSGCSIGGLIEDPEIRFGLIHGYNVYRLEGDAATIPVAADFMGAWQYFVSYELFDLEATDGAGTPGPDLDGDGLPEGNGDDAGNDGNPDGDLAGLVNPDGRGHSGDEVLIFQDSARNPDGSPRASGTGPDLSGARGYWYAFQPVLFSSETVPESLDGRGFGRDDEFVGAHSLDMDADGLMESIDLDLDGSPEFYSPQVAIGLHGYGLTCGGLPLLSKPVHARPEALHAGSGARMSAHRDALGRWRLELQVEPAPPGVEAYRAYLLDRRGRRPLGRGSRPVTAGVIEDVLELPPMPPPGPSQLSVELELLRGADVAPLLWGPYPVALDPTAAAQNGRRERERPSR